MGDALMINGREYLPVSIAADIVGYSEAYVTQLASGKWVDASCIQGAYYVDIDSLVRFISLSEEQQRETLEAQTLRERTTAALQQQKARQSAEVDTAWVILSKTGIVTISGLLVGLLTSVAIEEGLGGQEILYGAAEMVDLMAATFAPVRELLVANVYETVRDLFNTLGR